MTDTPNPAVLAQDNLELRAANLKYYEEVKVLRAETIALTAKVDALQAKLSEQMEAQEAPKL